MKIQYHHAVQDMLRTEGLTRQEIAEAMQAVEDAAAGKPRPLHRNENIEAIRDTNLNWYRLKPKHAVYRVVFRVDRARDTLIVMGIFRGDGTTYQRIAQLYHSSPRKNQP